MSISCCVALVISNEKQTSLGNYRRRNVSDVLFNYWSFTLSESVGWELMFITHSVKSFNFGLWDSVSSKRKSILAFNR